MILCASKQAIARHGRPRVASDLMKKPCLGYLRHDRPEPWKVGGENGDVVIVTPRGPFHTDDGDALRDAALAGAGFVWVLDFMVSEHLRTGHLVEVLATRCVETRTIEALYPSNRHLLPRVRVFVDLLVATFEQTA